MKIAFDNQDSLQLYLEHLKVWAFQEQSQVAVLWTVNDINGYPKPIRSRGASKPPGIPICRPGDVNIIRKVSANITIQQISKELSTVQQ